MRTARRIRGVSCIAATASPHTRYASSLAPVPDAELVNTFQFLHIYPGVASLLPRQPERITVHTATILAYAAAGCDGRFGPGVTGRRRTFCGPKAQPFAQPRATPWERGRPRDSRIGPTGQPFPAHRGERLARWAGTPDVVRRPAFPGRCPGLGERQPLRGVLTSHRAVVAPPATAFPHRPGSSRRKGDWQLLRARLPLSSSPSGLVPAEG